MNRAGQAGWQLGVWKERFDQLVVDRLVNHLAVVVQRIGAWGRRLQTGIVQQYLLMLVASAVALTILVQW